MNSKFLAVLFTSSVQSFGMWGGEEDRTFMDAADVFVFEVVFGCLFHHILNIMGKEYTT